MIQCVLIRWNAEKTQYSVLNWNVELQSPNVVGLDDDLEYLAKTTPFPIPEYDPRLYVLVTTQQFVDEVSEHTPLRKWEITYSTQERTTAEKNISVNEAEADANIGVFPTSKHLKYIALTLAILDKKASGLTIGNKEQAILDKVNAKALRIWNNHITGEAKKSDLSNNTPIDLDSDWEVIAVTFIIAIV